MRGLFYSNCWIAVGAAGMVHATYLALPERPTNWLLVAAAAAGTFAVYNVDRLVDVAGGEEVPRSERHLWIERHRHVLWGAAAVAGGVTAALGLMLSWSVMAVGVPLVAVAVAYSFPVFAERGASDSERWGRLKEIPGAKGGIVALVWAGTTAVLPLVEGTGSLGETRGIALVAERFLFILGLTLPFDVRDLDRDRADGVATFPMWIGVEGTQRLAWGVLVAAGVAAWWARGGIGSVPVQGALMASALLLVRLDRDRGELYYVAALDGMIVLQWLFSVGWAWMR